MAGYAGLVQLLDDLVVDPDVSGEDLAGAGLDFVAHGVPEVYLEDPVVKVGALVPGHLVQNATGCQLHLFLGWHFLQL